MATGETVLVLGPEDHGRAVSSADFAEAEFREPWKYERVGGRLQVMPPDGQRHIEGTSPWWRDLVAYWIGHREIVELVVPSAWIRVDDGTDRIGDIGVYLVADAPPPIPDRIPDLMFEVVSPGRVSRDRDYIQKRDDYHRFGVREYVIIDRSKGTVTVLEYAPDAYLERVLAATDEYRSPLLPGLTIRLAEALGNS